MRSWCSVCVLCCRLTSAASAAETAAAIAIHPENPHYFLFRGKPLVLIAATEHYASVINRRFDFVRYLDDAAQRKQTLTRTFLVFRDLASAKYPCSPLRVAAADYLAPWPWTGPGKAKDGGLLWDFDQWNPEYFQRLHQFLARASKLGIVVELTLFSNSYDDPRWWLNPLMSANNKQGVGKVAWPDYNSLRNKDLVRRQLDYARKIIQETHRYDNVYYEICNEPCGGLKPEPGGQNYATRAEVDAWQEEIAGVVRDELAKAGSPHLVFGGKAMDYGSNWRQDVDGSFAWPMVDVVTVHPQPQDILGGRTYDMGGFEAKELRLARLRDFCLATQGCRKPCVLDEDNCASAYRDDVGWTIHRKRAWTALLCGTHYDYIDFSIQAGSETGTPESRAKIRTWMRHLAEFIDCFDFVRAQAVPQWIEQKPEHLVVSALVKPGSDYIAYLADDREVISPDAGKPIQGEIAFRLPQGVYHARLYWPVSGEYAPGKEMHGGREPVIFKLPAIQHDVAVRVTRAR